MEQSIKQRKIPERQCLGCNEHKPKAELMRVVRTAEGEIVIDFTGKKSGRGAYVCKSLSCLKKARKTRRIDKNLNCEISNDIYDNMEAEMSDYE